MKTTTLLSLCTLALLAAAPAWAVPCPPDSVQVGPLCVDKYEASVWQITVGLPRPSGPVSTQLVESLVGKIKKGKATLADLNKGADQHGIPGLDYSCSDTGNDCDNIYAVSIAGVRPSTIITWFQAQQACMNAGKRLLTNAEWQGAVAGTVDPGENNDGLTNTKCHTDHGSSADLRNTGGAGATPGGDDSCISKWGVEDMVGNVSEWVADWEQGTTDACVVFFAETGDFTCLSGGFDEDVNALIRGGGASLGIVNTGVFVAQSGPPTASVENIGFRCTR